MKPKTLDKAISKVITPIEDVRFNLDNMKEEFKKALPPQISADKFIRVAMTAIQTTPSLLKTDRRTLYGELVKCATDGLIPDGREATIYPYKIQGVPTAKYIPMVGGILKKIRNSGEISTISSQVIYQNDDFRYWIDDDGEHVEHEPNLFEERGERIGVYSLANTKDGEVYIEVMNTEQVTDVKNTSRAKETGPWSGPFEDEMWRKTCLRRLSKRLPMSTDVEEVIRRDGDIYDLNPEQPPKPKQMKSPRLNELIGKTEDTPPSEETVQKEIVENQIIQDILPTAETLFGRK